MENAKADADRDNHHKGFRATDISAKAAYSPVADLYPEVTVMFADIGLHCVEFVREPKQVFTLLETHGAFDTIADRRGSLSRDYDSYVAVGPS
jgi:hypothetical protein